MTKIPTTIRKTGVYGGREYTVTFQGYAAIQVQSVSPVTGA